MHGTVVADHFGDVLDFLRLLQDLLYRVDEIQAVAVKGQAASVPLNDIKPQLLLHILQNFAQVWLGDKALLCRLIDGAAPINFQNVLQISNV